VKGSAGRRIVSCWIGLVAVVAGLAATPTSGQASASTTTCPAVPESQPFLGLGDSNWYALVPNGDFSNNAGGGWQLSGGAQIVPAVLPTGASGNVLSLPRGAKAISPPMCVDMTYANVRAWVKANPGISVTGLVAGHSQSQTLNGRSSAWTAPPAVNVLPGGLTGVVQLQLVFQFTGSTGSGLVYDIFVDPRMKH
jgi:hypothetical protein